MTTGTPRTRALLTVAAVLVVASGCGGASGTASDDGADAAVTTTSRESADEPASSTTTRAHSNDEGSQSGEKVVIAGVVIDIEGNLASTESFTILAEDGRELSFRPSSDATFHGGPLSHLRDHLVSGTPVQVEYIVATDGSLSASYVEDADHDQ